MKLVYLRPCFVCVAIISGLFACKKGPAPAADDASAINTTATLFVAPGNDAAVAVSWYQLQLKLIKETSGITQPAAARAIAYTGITLYQAGAWETRGGSSLKDQLNGLSYVPVPESGKKYNWNIAANSAMAAIIRNLFPAADAKNTALITQLEIDNLDVFSKNCTQAEIIRSVNFGRQVAGSIYQWSASDNGKEVYALH